MIKKIYMKLDPHVFHPQAGLSGVFILSDAGCCSTAKVNASNHLLKQNEPAWCQRDNATSPKTSTQLSVPQVQSPVCWYHPWIDLTSPVLPDEEKGEEEAFRDCLLSLVWLCPPPNLQNYSSIICRKRNQSVLIFKENSWALAKEQMKCQHFWNLYLGGSPSEND